MSYRKRRIGGFLGLLVVALGAILLSPDSYETTYTPTEPTASATDGTTLALDVLERLAVKGRAPKTGYDREQQFYKSCSR